MLLLREEEEDQEEDQRKLEDSTENDAPKEKRGRPRAEPIVDVAPKRGRGRPRGRSKKSLLIEAKLSYLKGGKSKANPIELEDSTENDAPKEKRGRPRAEPIVDVAPKRGRGRPRGRSKKSLLIEAKLSYLKGGKSKANPIELEDSTENDAPKEKRGRPRAEPIVDVAPKRGRGRPRGRSKKSLLIEAKLSYLKGGKSKANPIELEDSTENDAPKEKRGRPRAEPIVDVAPKRGRGRPRGRSKKSLLIEAKLSYLKGGKSKANPIELEDSTESDAPKEKSGRPRTKPIVAAGPPKKRGRPRIKPIVEAGPKRGRGRPKKELVIEVNPSDVDEGKLQADPIVEPEEGAEILENDTMAEVGSPDVDSNSNEEAPKKTSMVPAEENVTKRGRGRPKKNRTNPFKKPVKNIASFHGDRILRVQKRSISYLEQGETDLDFDEVESTSKRRKKGLTEHAETIVLVDDEADDDHLDNNDSSNEKETIRETISIIDKGNADAET
ncbi:unnamed protein product [Ambrosiozyma monospora]|uniref:Unnamed protein product n=1 Tax=Ambrosiozyma monospora TaxID=43982 RepID=A0A9W6WL86_AMBMO|nr:unnamed protein product [Ambrosiozyma monospora]